MSRSVIVNVRIPDEMKLKLTEVAIKMGANIKISHIIRMALEKYLKERR